MWKKRIKTVKIGDQEWMAENLNVTHYRNGDKIPEAITYKEWIACADQELGAWCYYDYDPANGKKYGKLYNWYAIKDPRSSAPIILAPKGWHVPSDDEWITLITNLGGEEIAGAKMKSTTGWEEDGNGTNESGFSALPSGSFFFDSHLGMGKEAIFWSSTEFASSTAWSLSLHCDSPEVHRRDNTNKFFGFSVFRFAVSGIRLFDYLGSRAKPWRK